MRMCSSLRLNEYRITRGTAEHEDYRSLIPPWNQNRDNADGKSQTTLAGRRRRDVGAISLSVFCPLSLCHRVRGVRSGMTKIHPERPDSDPSDHSLAADVLLRQEPDEEEDEDEEEDDSDTLDDDDDDDENDGYSE
jgi:hypothetical protein